MKMFKTIYKKKGKHRKKCLECGKLIKDGEEIIGFKFIKENYYPVRGLMKFVTWKFAHVNCYDGRWGMP